jgi:hypothetical protein
MLEREGTLRQMTSVTSGSAALEFIQQITRSNLEISLSGALRAITFGTIKTESNQDRKRREAHTEEYSEALPPWSQHSKRSLKE